MLSEPALQVPNFDWQPASQWFVLPQ
ncbi:unnamed protein product [Fusarium graminearum]|uniref:Uncharacterized protein n=1 Tax=Gibberella zeae TaxID=5518 RepID=A0A4E9DTX2_GIBZA|nr:unnamed protein product [Fusarium graminearum]